MTIDVQFKTVADSISALSIAGINIKDLDNIPENAEMTLPVLFPNPDEFINDIQFSFESFGTGGTAKMNLEYTLNYLYLHAKLGAGLGLNSVYGGMIQNLALILETIFANDVISGAVQIRLSNVPALGIIQDPSGRQFHGVALAFRVLEFAQ